MSEQSQSKYTFKRLILFIPLLLVWVLVSTLVLFISLHFNPKSPNFEALNSDAMLQITLIYIVHSIAFSIVPILFLIFWTSFDKLAVVAFSVVGVIALSIQYFWRQVSDNVSRIDCGDNCVPSVIPMALSESINARLLTALMLLMTIFVIIAIVRVKNSRKMSKLP